MLAAQFLHKVPPAKQWLQKLVTDLYSISCTKSGDQVYLK